MLVIFAEKLPPAVRGKLKVWFIEPMPNVFVSGVTDALAEKVANLLFESCPKEASMLIVRSKRKAPGYVLMQKVGESAQEKIVDFNGLQLVKQKRSRVDEASSETSS